MAPSEMEYVPSGWRTPPASNGWIGETVNVIVRIPIVENLVGRSVSERISVKLRLPTSWVLPTHHAPPYLRNEKLCHRATFRSSLVGSWSQLWPCCKAGGVGGAPPRSTTAESILSQALRTGAERLSLHLTVLPQVRVSFPTGFAWEAWGFRGYVVLTV
jgi:hypothetical protein